MGHHDADGLGALALLTRALRAAGREVLTRCQVHPLLAQAWRARLAPAVVIAANTGYRAGWVHFAARTARDVNLIDFLARHAPPGADPQYGGGHERATGGALHIPDWNAFVAGLGFGSQARVPA